MTLVAALSVFGPSGESVSSPVAKISCHPTASVVRVVGEGWDGVTVGYDASDNTVWVDNVIPVGNQGDTRRDQKSCARPGAPWKRIELVLGNGKDDTDFTGDSPEFAALPADIEVLLKGGRQIDVLYGHDGPDVIDGGRGRDYLLGRDGNDRLIGGVGDDELVGFDGDDHLDAVDGIKDQVLCGKGKDTAIVDSQDRPRECETVRSRSVSEAGSS